MDFYKRFHKTTTLLLLAVFFTYLGYQKDLTIKNLSELKCKVSNTELVKGVNKIVELHLQEADNAREKPSRNENYFSEKKYSSPEIL